MEEVPMGEDIEYHLTKTEDITEVITPEMEDVEVHTDDEEIRSELVAQQI